jgi:tyrosinase
VFWFHHGMLDRVWWIWQMQDPDNRVDLIPGGGGIDAENTIVELGWTAPAVPLSKLNDQLGGNDGQFCYIYV